MDNAMDRHEKLEIIFRRFALISGSIGVLVSAFYVLFLLFYKKRKEFV